MACCFFGWPSLVRRSTLQRPHAASLRTLPIATTLLAVVLGLAVLAGSQANPACPASIAVEPALCGLGKLGRYARPHFRYYRCRRPPVDCLVVRWTFAATAPCSAISHRTTDPSWVGPSSALTVRCWGFSYTTPANHPVLNWTLHQRHRILGKVPALAAASSIFLGHSTHIFACHVDFIIQFVFAYYLIATVRSRGSA
jgi:hypothetical protein